MALEIEFETGNSAFDESREYEVNRILRSIGDRISEGENAGNIYDINGNNIGYYALFE